MDFENVYQLVRDNSYKDMTLLFTLELAWSASSGVDSSVEVSDKFILHVKAQNSELGTTHSEFRYDNTLTAHPVDNDDNIVLENGVVTKLLRLRFQVPAVFGDYVYDSE